MLNLTLANGKEFEIERFTDNCINTWEELASLFNGTAAIHYDPDKKIYYNLLRYDPRNILFNVYEEDEVFDTEGGYAGNTYYVRIKSVEWDLYALTDPPAPKLSDNSFITISDDRFVRCVGKIMNRECKDNPMWLRDVIRNGCASGIVPDLIKTEDCYKILRRYTYDIEHMIQEIAEHVEENSISFQDFSFSQLIWMCFEWTIKEALRGIEFGEI